MIAASVNEARVNLVLVYKTATAAHRCPPLREEVSKDRAENAVNRDHKIAVEVVSPRNHPSDRAHRDQRQRN
jgi:hypothetical protein